jgi:hypothetical protein
MAQLLASALPSTSDGLDIVLAQLDFPTSHPKGQATTRFGINSDPGISKA